MAKVDADIHFLIFYVTLPVIGLLLVIHYVFDLNMDKLKTGILDCILTWVHHRYMMKEKLMLFEHLEDLKENTKHTFSILEIGVGGGNNFQFYPKGTVLSCVEPNHGFDVYWKKKLEQYKHIRLGGCFHTGAEKMLDVKSNAYDAVVCTLVLCSVKDPLAVVTEIYRVLKPGGTFFYMEHVAGTKGSSIRTVQDFLMVYTPYTFLCGGCNLNRETWTYLDESRFRSVQYRQYSIDSWIFFFVRPFLYGTAVK